MSTQIKPSQSPSKPVIDMTILQQEMDKVLATPGFDWAKLESTIDILQQNTPATAAGVPNLSVEQITLIDGQRRINGGLLNAINLILDALDTPEASGAVKDKVGAARDVLKRLLGGRPPGCESQL